MLEGANVAVTPLGSPVSEKATAELNPVPAVEFTVMGRDTPWAMLALVALSPRVNVPDTVRLMACALVTPPPVAVTVSVAVLPAALEAAVRVSMLVPTPGEAMLVGVKMAVTPVGSPLMVKATAALKLFTFAVVSVTDEAAPGRRETLATLEDKVKLADPRTVRANDWVFVVPPPTAPMVRL
jgi:hypothetical protein